MSIKILLSIKLTFLFAFANDSDLQNIFDKYKINGTLILSSLNQDEVYIYNKERSTKRYLPASTFKIINTLIALDEKAIKNEHEILKWDGIVRAYKPWNQNHTLESAFKVSCVWCFQKLARKIGDKKYLEHLNKIKYGNMKTGKNPSNFWLSGDLRISALQQIDFLKQIYLNNLHYSNKHLSILKNIMIVEQTSDYIFRAKSGWTKNIGWYVGYLQKEENVWFFALNMGIQNPSDLKYRKSIVINALKKKNLL